MGDMIFTVAMRAVPFPEKHYQLSQIHPHVDYINLMTYDYVSYASYYSLCLSSRNKQGINYPSHAAFRHCRLATYPRFQLLQRLLLHCK